MIQSKKKACVREMDILFPSPCFCSFADIFKSLLNYLLYTQGYIPIPYEQLHIIPLNSRMPSNRLRWLSIYEDIMLGIESIAVTPQEIAIIVGPNVISSYEVYRLQSHLPFHGDGEDSKKVLRQFLRQMVSYFSSENEYIFRNQGRPHKVWIAVNIIQRADTTLSPSFQAQFNPIPAYNPNQLSPKRRYSLTIRLSSSSSQEQEDHRSIWFISRQSIGKLNS